MNTTPTRDLSRFTVPSILDQIASDAGISPLFAAAICQVGSTRWHEVRAEEAADHAADMRRERDEAGE